MIKHTTHCTCSLLRFFEEDDDDFPEASSFFEEDEDDPVDAIAPDVHVCSSHLMHTHFASHVDKSTLVGPPPFDGLG